MLVCRRYAGMMQGPSLLCSLQPAGRRASRHDAVLAGDTHRDALLEILRVVVRVVPGSACLGLGRQLLSLRAARKDKNESKILESTAHRTQAGWCRLHPTRDRVASSIGTRCAVVEKASLYLCAPSVWSSGCIVRDLTVAAIFAESGLKASRGEWKGDVVGVFHRRALNFLLEQVLQFRRRRHQFGHELGHGVPFRVSLVSVGLKIGQCAHRLSPVRLVFRQLAR